MPLAKKGREIKRAIDKEYGDKTEQGRVSARSRALSAGVCPYELRSKEAAEWQSGYAGYVKSEKVSD